MTQSELKELKSKLLLDLLWVVLFPISCLWMWVMALRRNSIPTLKTVKSKLPIICVGNIHSGGSGKTPIVKLLIHKLDSLNPILLARGYGGSLSGEGAEIDRNQVAGYSLYGDEPWMIAKQMTIPVFIGKNRRKMLEQIEKKFPKGLVIMDDGFQRLSIEKDINLICINADKELTASFCLPLGELREPLSAIGSADAVVLTPGAEQKNSVKWHALLAEQFPSIPVFEAQRRLDGLFDQSGKLEVGPEERAVCFCGIASPERFISSVQGLLPLATHLKSFKDHHHYSLDDVNKLIGKGKHLGAKLFITTDKDWFKVIPHFKNSDLKLVSLRQANYLSEDFWVWISKKLGRQIN